MLLLFAVGVGNLGWILAPGTVMTVEKISAPLGVGLIGWSLALVAFGASTT